MRGFCAPQEWFDHNIKSAAGVKREKRRKLAGLGGAGRAAARFAGENYGIGGELRCAAGAAALPQQLGHRALEEGGEAGVGAGRGGAVAPWGIVDAQLGAGDVARLQGVVGRREV